MNEDNNEVKFMVKCKTKETVLIGLMTIDKNKSNNVNDNGKVQVLVSLFLFLFLSESIRKKTQRKIST